MSSMVRSRAPKLHLVAVLLAVACGGSAPPPTQPSGAEPVMVQPPPASTTTSPPPPGGASPGGSASGACCVPQGAYDPSNDSYERCVADGGRPWGSDGCGVDQNGKVQAPPPSAAPTH